MRMGVSTAGTHPACFPSAQNARTWVRHPVGTDSGYGPTRCGLTIKPKRHQERARRQVPDPACPAHGLRDPASGKGGPGRGDGIVRSPSTHLPSQVPWWVAELDGGRADQAELVLECWPLRGSRWDLGGCWLEPCGPHCGPRAVASGPVGGWIKSLYPGPRAPITIWACWAQDQPPGRFQS